MPNDQLVGRQDSFVEVLPDSLGGYGCNLQLPTRELMQIAMPTHSCFVWLKRETGAVS